MLDRSLLELPPAQGERLAVADYRADFRVHRGAIRDADSWKFERQQDFEDKGDSWEAFCQGRWEETLRLFEERRESLLEGVRQDQERNTVFHRVRVVEEPLTAYLQWELHSLRVQAESGKKIRVIGPGAWSALEADGPLPEVVVVGGQVLYRVLYNEAGALDGAIRFRDPDLIKRWEGFIGQLYEDGEDLLPYFERQVAHLPPPQMKAE
ncbi:DUF6879 family protein [Streptomyces sp. NPDC059850]|uniref:DUF6879 family protein n=1 Tax=Streptomyces sp. NPDC059850 TaxID=3346970 RepID=UPI003653E3D5